jgi:hypothetical protein
MCHAQALLGHRVASVDLAEPLDRAFEALVEKLERQRFAAAHRPRPNRVQRT